jgi:hypothetical protein
VNAAFLLLATCMSDAHPVLISTPECSTCTVGSEPGKPGGICHMSGPWSFWCCGKKKECGHHIHCPHPGPIPGTQHLTFKQACKDWLCPKLNMIPDSQHCEKECAAVIVEVPSNVEHLRAPAVGGNQSRMERIQRMPTKAKTVTPVYHRESIESPY